MYGQRLWSGSNAHTLDLYVRVFRLPSDNTRTRIKDQQGLVFDGAFYHQTCRSGLSAAHFTVCRKVAAFWGCKKEHTAVHVHGLALPCSGGVTQLLMVWIGCAYRIWLRARSHLRLSSIVINCLQIFTVYRQIEATYKAGPCFEVLGLVHCSCVQVHSLSAIGRIAVSVVKLLPLKLCEQRLLNWQST